MISLKKLFTPVDSMDAIEAKNYMAEHAEGTYTLLDVRQPGEYETEHIPGAKLIPLPGLKDGLSQLDKHKPVIAYCAIGGRSLAAAQLLSGLGFKEIYNLQGGIRAWQGQKAVGPQELNLELVHGDEKPAEMIALAYGMEMGLGVFYQNMIETSQDDELQALFSKLADIEAHHKKRLFELLTEIDPAGKDVEAYEADIRPTILEGGFQLDDFMKKNESFLHTVPDVLDLAMMLETQALDLYLRFADKSTYSQSQDVLFKLADEEKSHLEALGQLVEKKTAEV
ncbi:MAG: rhodanese-like domain-containing protein [Desulfobacterales bacterium]|jgi:rhodanese-related sulfurtransferase/rubrerythrin